MRARALQLLLVACGSGLSHQFVGKLMDALVLKDRAESSHKTRYYGDSQLHRLKHRVMQSLLVLEPLLDVVSVLVVTVSVEASSCTTSVQFVSKTNINLILALIMYSCSIPRVPIGYLMYNCVSFVLSLVGRILLYDKMCVYQIFALNKCITKTESVLDTNTVLKLKEYNTVKLLITAHHTLYCVFFFYFCCDGLRLCLGGNGAMPGPLSIHQMMHECAWSSNRILLTGKPGGLREKPKIHHSYVLYSYQAIHIIGFPSFLLTLILFNLISIEVFCTYFVDGQTYFFPESMAHLQVYVVSQHRRPQFVGFIVFAYVSMK